MLSIYLALKEHKMILYISVILISMTIIALCNIFLGTATFGYFAGFVVLAVVLSTIFEIAVDGLFAFIVNKLPNKWFSPDKKFFFVSKRKQIFYEKLGIKKWKDKVLELGVLGGFRKNKIQDPKSAEYFETFLIECNKGVTCHRLGYIFGFLDIFIFPLQYALVIGLPVAVVNLFLSVLPTMVLQYNTPKLMAVYTRLKMLETKQKEKEDKLAA